MRVRISAAPGDAELAGLDGSYDWGEAVVAADGAADLVVALGNADEPAPDVRWLRAAEPEGTGPDGAGPAARVIAPAGSGLWRRAPWPVRDELFGRSPGHGAAVVGGQEEERAEIAGPLRDRGIEVTEALRLDAETLREVAAVVMLAEHDALPAEAAAVLAARRVLVASPCRITFGLQPGVDHLVAVSPSEASAYTMAAVERPGVFGTLRAFGALAAERHRASAVYGRLAADIAGLAI